MAKAFFKKNMIVDTPFRYEISNEDGTSPAIKKIEFKPANITQAGDKVNAEDINGIQENSIYEVEAVRVVEGVNEFYDIAIAGINDFTLFNAKLLIKFNETNTKVNPQLRILWNSLNKIFPIRFLNDFADIQVNIGDLKKEYIGYINQVSNKFLLWDTYGANDNIYDTMALAQLDLSLKSGDIIQVLGYYTKGDGAGHKRIVSATDDGSGVACGSLWLNILPLFDNSILGSWFGIITTDMSKLQKALDYCKDNLKNFKLPTKEYVLSRNLLPINFDHRRIKIDFCNSDIIINDNLQNGDIVFNLNLTTDFSFSSACTGSFENLRFRGQNFSNYDDIATFFNLDSANANRNISGTFFKNIKSRLSNKNSLFADIKNNMYLFSFIECTSSDRVVMPSGCVNYGENIFFNKCVFFNNVGQNAVVENNNKDGNFNFLSCSLDYSDKLVHAKSGGCNFEMCHFETRNNGGNTSSNTTESWFELGVGGISYCSLNFSKCVFLQSNTGVLSRNYFLKSNSIAGTYKDSNNHLTIENCRFQNLKTVSNYLIFDENKNTNYYMNGNFGNYVNGCCSYLSDDFMNEFINNPLNIYTMNNITLVSFNRSTRTFIFNKAGATGVSASLEFIIDLGNKRLADFSIFLTLVNGGTAYCNVFAGNTGEIANKTIIGNSRSEIYTRFSNIYHKNGRYLVINFNLSNPPAGNITLEFDKLHLI